jgi:hypothetical protein
MNSNPNSPENLLKPWLDQMDEYANHLRVIDRSDLPLQSIFLSHLLNFADQHQKLFEILFWMKSEDGERFFLSASEYSSTIYSEFEFVYNFAAFPDDDDDEELVDDALEVVRHWIHEKSGYVPFELMLN